MLVSFPNKRDEHTKRPLGCQDTHRHTQKLFVTFIHG